MKLVGAAGQAIPHFLFDASGTIASSTAPQLILPRRYSCSYLMVMNLSASLPMYLEMGSARAVATISNGQVTNITVLNGGFGFSRPPMIQIRGGGANMFQGFLGSNDPNAPSAGTPAQAHCVMTGSAPNQSVSSIIIDNPGSGYTATPYVLMLNNPQDPIGCADPSSGSGSGILLPANGGNYHVNGTTCTTDPIALYCSTGAGAKFTCKWMD
jgi:hypothetical protein